MSDSDDGKWVVPALIALALVGASLIGLSRPNDRRSPEDIVASARSFFERNIGGRLPVEPLNPCAQVPRPACCATKNEARKTCAFTIKAEGDGLRRVSMTKPSDADVQVEISVRVSGELQTETLEWKPAPGGRARATADVGPQDAYIKLVCDGSCVVRFE